MAHENNRPLADISRLRWVLGVLVVVAGALILANLALLLVFGPAPAPLRRAEVLDPGEYQRVGQRIAAAERELSAPTRPDERPLAVILGLSTAREDIDPAVLGPALCSGMRVLNLGSSGGSYGELAFYLQTLRRTRLRSALTVLAVHPVWLAGRVAPAPTSGAPVSTGSPSRSSAKELVRRWAWLYSNRRGMHAVLVNALWQIRERAAQRFELGATEVFPAAGESPWVPRIAYQGERGAPDFLDEQLQAWREYGWFDASRFSESGAEADAVLHLMAEARALGDRVVVVLMPEHSAVRRRIPDAATSALRAVFSREGSIPIIDLRDRLPDVFFYDYAHVNAAGRERASSIMGPTLSFAAGCGRAPK